MIHLLLAIIVSASIDSTTLMLGDQTDLHLQTGIEEEVQLFPHRNSIEHTYGHRQVMRQHAVLDRFNLRTRCIDASPVLLVLAVQQGIEQTRLHTEMLRQVKCECRT